MTAWHLAQLNVARILAPIDSPQLGEFVAQLDEINALADASPGFVWRLQGASGNSTDIAAPDPALLVNMSVWSTPELLFEFVYKTAHTKVMVRRREWFGKLETYQVLWWIPVGHLPTVEEAFARLELLRVQGPSLEAFTFKQRFGPPGSRETPTNMRPEPYCAAEVNSRCITSSLA
jgi:hypothetical protein